MIFYHPVRFPIFKMKRVNTDPAAGPSKKYRSQCFRDNYCKEWPCLTRSHISANHVFCKVCVCDFSIAHGGRDDCRRHVISKKHQEREKEKSSTLDKFFCANSDSSDDATHAELLYTSYLIEHNLAIATSDHAKPLFRSMFRDSRIAKNFTCGRTKTTSLVHFLAQKTTKDILGAIREKSFSLATDGSSDVNSKKLYPIVITYFDEMKGRTSTVLLSLAESVDNTGKGIFDTINKTFNQKNVDWKKCISFSCDNASTMIGSMKGVVSHIKKLQPSILLIRCSCHLVHLAAKHAAYKLDFDFENFIIQIFFYLEKSSKRKHSFQESQEFCGVKPYKILKYVSTRWLSLLMSINRILDQWEALEHFFTNQPENTDQLNSIRRTFKNPLTKLYLLFLSSVLPIFTAVNEGLQTDAPQIHRLKEKFHGLLMEIVTRFIKPSAISAENITNLTIDKKKHQKQDSDLVIGGRTRGLKESLNLSESDNSSFYKSVRLFYVTAYSYIVKKFPLNDEFLNHVQIADIKKRKDVNFSSVQYLASLLNFSVEEIDKLESEFALYQTEDIMYDDTEERIDEAWNKISLMKKGEIPKYGTLCKLIKDILTVPHSNAPTERIFSVIKKNMTEFRPNLSTECLNSLLIEKIKNLSDGKFCYQREFTKEELNLAKKATKQNVFM